MRPVYPIAIRNPEFFEQVNPMWVPYLLKDVFRVADFNGIPFQWPKPDPVVMDPETRVIAEEQPYIHRLTWWGVEAARQGKGLDFACEVGRAIWGDGLTDWHMPEVLAPVVNRAGLDLTAMDGAVAADPKGYADEVLINQQTQETAGHWGTPCLVFEGEPFFGQDRLDMAVWRMQQKGLAKR